MATYKCNKCGMAVNASCAKCDAPLVNDILNKEDGTTVQVSNVLMIMERLNLHYVADKI